MNQDLKNFLRWLKANKLSLNIRKASIFHPKNTKIDCSVKFKLNGRLNPISTVKYLVILLDNTCYGQSKSTG